MVSAAIDACDVGGHWQAALGFLRLMPDWRLLPEAVWHCFVFFQFPDSNQVCKP